MPAGAPPISTRGTLGWIILALSAVLGGFAVLTRIPWLPPLVQAVPAWWVLFGDVRDGHPRRGAARMVFWAVLASITVIELTIHAPHAAEAGILRGAAYREEMFAWIRTGIGAESDPSRFLPEHALHYGLVLVLSFGTVGLAGLLLGAVLLNYMNFYVGALVLASTSPVTASIAGWPPWSYLRVLGFICGAVAAAYLMQSRLLGRAPWSPRAAKQLLTASVALVIADAVVKTLLAPHWRVMLARIFAG